MSELLGKKYVIHPLCVAKAFLVGRMMDRWSVDELRERIWELINEGCVPETEAYFDLQSATKLLWESKFEPSPVEKENMVRRAKSLIERAFNRLKTYYGV